MMDKIIKFISKDYNFHAKSFKFGFFSDFCRSKLFLVSGFWSLAVLPNKPIASSQ